MVRILHDDWSIRLGENRSDQPLKHLAAMQSSVMVLHRHSMLSIWFLVRPTFFVNYISCMLRLVFVIGLFEFLLQVKEEESFWVLEDGKVIHITLEKVIEILDDTSRAELATFPYKERLCVRSSVKRWICCGVSFGHALKGFISFYIIKEIYRFSLFTNLHGVLHAISYRKR